MKGTTVSEVAVYNSTLETTGAVDLMRFAEEASQVRRIAQVLSQTSFVPDAYRNRPDEATAAILFGREVGIDPMHSLQEIVVIQGRPTMSANGMRGIAQRAGVIFEIDEEQSNPEKVVMRAKGPHQRKWTTSVWDMERARKMGLANKDNWKRMPLAMLTARCTTELCRLVAANVLLGLGYSIEELSDEVDQQEDVNPPTVPKTRTVRRKTVEPAPADEPELIPNPPEPPISVGTRKILMAVFGNASVPTREARLAAISGAIGRQVQSANELTEAEAQQVISYVEEQNRDEWPPAVEVAP